MPSVLLTKRNNSKQSKRMLGKWYKWIHKEEITQSVKNTDVRSSGRIRWEETWVTKQNSVT